MHASLIQFYEQLSKQSPGGEQLPCNHVCQRKCHPSDKIHESPCTEPCPKWCTAGLHQCKRLCSEFCGICEEPVKRNIDKCGHKQLVPRHIQPKDFVCQEKCTKVLKCGHVCKNKCGEERTTECMQLVNKVLSCEHTQQVECHIDPEEVAKQCKHPCNEILACEHKCSGTCGKCHQGCLHKPCREKCTRMLLCGHPCSDFCGKNCPPCCERCMYSCQHGPCDHPCSSSCRPHPHECTWKCDHFECSRKCAIGQGALRSTPRFLVVPIHVLVFVVNRVHKYAVSVSVKMTLNLKFHFSLVMNMMKTPSLWY